MTRAAAANLPETPVFCGVGRAKRGKFIARVPTKKELDAEWETLGAETVISAAGNDFDRIVLDGTRPDRQIGEQTRQLDCEFFHREPFAPVMPQQDQGDVQRLGLKAGVKGRLAGDQHVTSAAAGGV